jgi:hypothetical protein
MSNNPIKPSFENFKGHQQKFSQAFISKLERARAIIQSSLHYEGDTSSQFLQ